MRLVIAIFTLISLIWHGQLDPVLLGSLPVFIDEASGLECSHPDTCWTHNDSSDGEHIYLVNPTGAFLGQRVLLDASQEDYEDLALAPDGRLFIGDFGNNNNNRTDLKIYISQPSSSAGSLVNTETIEFSLEDQISFPPASDELNFDVESMIYHEEFLYLFTRNRTNPYNGICKMYRLNATAGIQQAVLIDDFFGNLSPVYSSIGAADISPSGTRLALVSSASLFLFHDLESWPLISGDPIYTYFSFTRNFEGLSFIDECTVYLVSESTNEDPGKIFSLNTCQIIPSAIEEIESIAFTYTNGTISYADDIYLDEVRVFDVLGREQHTRLSNGSIAMKGPMSDGIYVIIYEREGVAGRFTFYHQNF